MPSLIKALEKHKNLIALDLSYNFLYEDHKDHPDLAKYFIQLIQHHINLEKLDISACHINDHELEELFRGLSDDEVELVAIRLEKNLITSKSGKLIFERKFHRATIGGLIRHNNNLNLEGDPMMMSKSLYLHDCVYSKQQYPALPSLENFKTKEGQRPPTFPLLQNKKLS